MMWNKPLVKKATAGALALAMLMGSQSAVLADKDDKKKGPGHSNGKANIEFKRDGGKLEIKKDGKIEIKMEFKDVDDQFIWALQQIASLSARGIFKGYEDGTFQPRKPISRIEAITAAVRLLGLEQEAQSKMNVKLNFKDAAQVPAWATGYVAVALENDLFLETDTSVQSEKPADRLWATMLLVKAMKLEAEAKARMNTTLQFQDAKEIPAGAVGYVAIAIERGLIRGYENNTFRPNQPVTRAELAVLLERTGNQLPEEHDQNAFRGEVTATASGTLTVKRSNGTTAVVAVDPAAFVYRNGIRTTLSAVVAGDTVLVRTYNNVAVFVEVTKAATTTPDQTAFTVNGTFAGSTFNNQGKMTSVSVTQTVYGGTQLYIYNTAEQVSIVGNPALLIPNNNVQVELKGKANLVETITIK